MNKGSLGLHKGNEYKVDSGCFFSLYDSQDTLNLLTNVANMYVLMWVGCYTTFQGTALRMCRSQTVVFEECQFKLMLIVVAQNGNVPVSHCFIFKYNIEP